MISSRITRSALGRGKSLQQNSEIESAYFTSKPPNWQEQLKNIKEMRKDRTAPVDIMMGWDRFCDPEAKPETIRYQVLISLMLSNKTKDEINVPAAMGRLKTAGCDVNSILKMSDKQLGELISPVGLWKNKVRYIKGTTKILQEKYEGDVPRTINELCDLPGIGRKMAHLIMNCVWGKVLSIGVDPHVHRISNRLGWVSTWDTEETRRALQDWLPREHWRDIDVDLVGFGQTVCKPIFTMCDICLNQDICPSAFKKCLSKKSVKV